MSMFSGGAQRRVLRLGLALVTAALGGTGLMLGMTADTQAQTARSNQGFVSGVVESSRGREAGVWVIAETTELPTKFIKIVVTGDDGRFTLPELPNATYDVWVRGYGLVDSKPVKAPSASLLATLMLYSEKVGN